MYSVMVVDDFDFSRHELKAKDVWGERTGFYIAAEASNGRDALQMLRRQPVDLVITDIRMPFVDGIALTEAALNEKLCHCVILVSQVSSFEYARKGIQIGAFEYLVKPVNGDDLLESLRRASYRIRERHMERIKLSYANQALKNQPPDRYPYEEFARLIDSIKEGGLDPAGIASKLVDRIWLETEFDLLKSAYCISRVQQDLDNAVQIEFPWISKLTNTISKLTDFTGFSDTDTMKASFLSNVGRISATLSKYRLADSDSAIIKAACGHILENVDAPVSLNSLARKLYISDSYLSLLFKQKTGVNLNSYITFTKMERARILLEEGYLRSYEIAEKIGFSDEYFSKLFKKTYAITPIDYRKKYLNKGKT